MVIVKGKYRKVDTHKSKLKINFNPFRLHVIGINSTRNLSLLLLEYTVPSTNNDISYHKHVIFTVSKHVNSYQIMNMKQNPSPTYHFEINTHRVYFLSNIRKSKSFAYDQTVMTRIQISNHNSEHG